MSKLSRAKWDWKFGFTRIIFLYWLGRKLYIKSLEDKYGYKLFHWTMPYGEAKGLEITTKGYDVNTNHIS